MAPISFLNDDSIVKTSRYWFKEGINHFFFIISIVELGSGVVLDEPKEQFTAILEIFQYLEVPYPYNIWSAHAHMERRTKEIEQNELHHWIPKLSF